MDLFDHIHEGVFEDESRRFRRPDLHLAKAAIYHVAKNYYVRPFSMPLRPNRVDLVIFAWFPAKSLTVGFLKIVDCIAYSAGEKELLWHFDLGLFLAKSSIFRVSKNRCLH